ncbi:MAG: transporter substrate-binding domain-containing protein, partial [Bacteroidales bacterium]|nr:transporter substrate-binding domain-containing protein [Bacteroidales bacterium]
MKRILIALCLFFLVIIAAYTSDYKALSGIRVGVSEMPPYVVFKGDQVTGVSADIWKSIADSLKIQYSFVRFSNYMDLQDKLEKGDID